MLKVLIILLAVGVVGVGGVIITRKLNSQSVGTTSQVENYATGYDNTSSADIITLTTSPTPSQTMTQPETIFDQSKTYTAQVQTTAGELTIELSSKTPITSNNFVSLAEKGYYNNTIFHRVISGFMIQGGDPTGTGTGGPGYKFNDEPFEGEYTRGTVAMANAGPNTNGSQFFIMHADYPLPKNYVIFGKVTSGLETIDKIATAPVSVSSMGERSKPVEPVKITSVTITKK